MTRIGMVLVRRFVFLALVLGLAWLLATGAAAAQTDAFGPDAIFDPPDDFSRVLFDCQGPTCVEDTMRAFGASESAIAFAAATEGGYLVALEEHGRVDRALVLYPTRANDNGQQGMVNGAPPLVMVEAAWDVNLAGHPAYASLLTAYPNLILWGGDNLFGGVAPLADGGQRFLFNYALLDGCHACDLRGWAQVAFDFDAAGVFLGMTLLPPPTEGTAAPPEPTAMPTVAAPILPAPVTAPAATPRQIAYHDAAGAIWLVDDSGANPRQIAAGERCCVSWSADGRQLFYLRVPPGAGDTTPRPIMVYDLETGQERLLGAETLVVGSLGTMTPGGRLPFIHNRLFPDAEIITNIACVADIDPQGGGVNELGCLDEMYLQRPVEAPDSTGLMMGYSGFESAGIRLYTYRFGFTPNPIGCCGAPSHFPDNSYATWASQYYLSNIWSYAPATVGIFRWHGGSDTPEPLYLSSQPLGSPDVSPEGDRLVFSEADNVTIYDIARGETRVIGAGSEPRWRPGAPLVAAPTVAPTVTSAPLPSAPAMPATLDAAAGQLLPTATAAVVTEATAPADGAVANVVEGGAEGATDAGEAAQTSETEDGLAADVRDGWPWLLLALVALVVGAGALGLLLAGRRRAAPVAPATLPPPPTAAAPKAPVAPVATPVATPPACPECGQPRPRPARFCTSCGYRFPGDPNIE